MNDKKIERKFANIEAKIAQNRGYTTELKERFEKADLNFTRTILNNKRVLLDVNNSLISLCEVLDTKFKSPINAISLLLEWAHAEKSFLLKNNEKIRGKQKRKKEVDCRFVKEEAIQYLIKIILKGDIVIPTEDIEKILKIKEKYELKKVSERWKKKMTDDEIMRFNEEIMSKVHKRKVQPLETEKKEDKEI